LGHARAPCAWTALLGEHGNWADSAAGLRSFERQMKGRRLKASTRKALKQIAAGLAPWAASSSKEQMLELMEGKAWREPTASSQRSWRAGAGRVLALAPPNFDTPNFWTLDFGLWTIRLSDCDPGKLAMHCPAAERTTLRSSGCGAGAESARPKGPSPCSIIWASEPRPNEKPQSALEPCAQLDSQSTVWTPFRAARPIASCRFLTLSRAHCLTSHLCYIGTNRPRIYQLCCHASLFLYPCPTLLRFGCVNHEA